MTKFNNGAPFSLYDSPCEILPSKHSLLTGLEAFVSMLILMHHLILRKQRKKTKYSFHVFESMACIFVALQTSLNTSCKAVFIQHGRDLSTRMHCMMRTMKYLAYSLLYYRSHSSLTPFISFVFLSLFDKTLSWWFNHHVSFKISHFPVLRLDLSYMVAMHSSHGS